MFENYPDVMNVAQVADALGICTATVYDLLHVGRIRYFTVGKVFRISKRALFDFVETGSDLLDIVSS